MTDEIETSRLVLRRVVMSDAERITSLIKDPRIYRMVARIAPNQDLQTTRDWIATHADRRAADTDHVFAVTRFGDPLIGLVGMHRSSVHYPFELGYWTAPEAWGAGYTTESAGALINWIEKTRKHKAIVSGYFVDNPASGRVLAKLGFMRAYRAAVYCAGRDRKVDHYYMVRISDAG